jgi:hypothetical protein
MEHRDVGHNLESGPSKDPLNPTLGFIESMVSVKKIVVIVLVPFSMENIHNFFLNRKAGNIIRSSYLFEPGSSITPSSNDKSDLYTLIVPN